MSCYTFVTGVIGNFCMKFVLCELGFKTKSKYCKTDKIWRTGRRILAQRAKCETPSTLLEACSLTWTESWKHCLAASSASRAHGFVFQHFLSYLAHLQNMLNKLWAPPLLLLAGSSRGGEMVASNPAPPHVGSPAQAPFIPHHLQKVQQESASLSTSCSWADVKLLVHDETIVLSTLQGTAWSFQPQLPWKVPQVSLVPHISQPCALLHKERCQPQESCYPR